MRALALVVAASGCLSQPGPPGDPVHGWHELTGANQPGALHSARLAWDDARKSIVLHGGVDASGASAKTWQLSAGDVWTEICATSALPALYSPAFAYDPIGHQLVVAGGSTTADFTQPTTTVFTCSSTTAGATWLAQPVPVPAALVGAQLVYDEGRAELILIGGIDATGMFAHDSYVTHDVSTWTALGDASPAAFGGAATNVTYDAHDNRILALKNYIGPFGSALEPTSELWQLGSSAGNWALVCGPSMHDCQWDARSDAALVHLGDSLSTIAFGGSGGAPRATLAGSWVLDNDELVQAHDDPPARQRAGVAYDPERERAVVYGGNGAGCTGEAGNCDTTWILE